MSYLVLARKYRPQTFAQVVRQEHVTRTLSNAITSNRVAHAILFSGPRGTGKTTVARILAKALNCEANRENPSPTPCNTCRSCREITTGNAVDVFEIDGASNNSVEQVRELRENIRYMPAHSPLKIYIIDEVHMLSTAAFNALLKTLEEPPPHVMFFFATTEPHKIPITILSRCQRHDFRRIDLNSITQHMMSLCSQEGIAITTESLELIAKEADGSMRDALSLLDQVISSSDGAVEHEKLLNILGVVDRKIIFSMSAAILGGKISTLLDIIDEVYDRGHDVKKLYSDLIEHFRNLVIAKIAIGNHKLLDVPAHEIELMTEQVSQVPETFLSQILDLLFKEESAVKFSSQPKIAVEMTLIRIHQIRPALSIDALIEKLDTLKEAVLSSRPVTDDKKGALDFNSDPERPPTALSEKRTDFFSENQRPMEQSGRQDKTNSLANENEMPPYGHFQQHCGKRAEPLSDCPNSRRISITQENLEVTWNRLLALLSNKYPSLAACLANSRLHKLDDRHMEIKVTGSVFNIKRIKSDKSIAILKKVSRDVLGKDMTIDIIADQNKTTENQASRSNPARLRQNAISHTLVSDTIEILGGSIVDVKML